MRISTKLYSSFLLVVAFTAALGFYISYENGNTLKEFEGKVAALQAEKIIKRFGQSIHGKIMEVGAATKRSFLRSKVAESNKQFAQMQDIDAHFVKMEKSWGNSIHLAEFSLQQKVRTNVLSNELRDEFITLYESMRGFRVLSNIFVTNKYGAVIAQTDQENIFNHSKEKWWQETKKREMYVGMIEYNNVTESYGIPAAFSIVDDTGDFLGVLKTVIDIKAMIRTVELASLKYETSEITLLTPEGRIIYRTKPYRFMEDFSSWQFFDRLQGNENYFVGASKGDKDKLFSFSRAKGYQQYPGYGWVMILEKDLDEVMEPAYSLRKKTMIAVAFLIFLGTVITLVISGNFSQSLKKLNEGTARIGKGDLGYILETDAKDEIGDLTRSLDIMRRNLQLTQGKLVLQEKLAAIGKLSGSVAHDIRNPLGAISNSIFYLKLISNDQTDSKVMKHISLMERQVERVSEIINDLMEFSRENEPELVKGDINRLIIRSVESIQLPDSIQLVTELDQSLPTFSFDATQIDRIISNLLSNAIQAMPDGGMITVLSRIAGKYIEVEMRDDGVGIAREKNKNIFEPLYTTKSKGVGLGLSIVKTFVEKHNGTIEVESEKGKGTSFTVKLPNQ